MEIKENKENWASHNLTTTKSYANGGKLLENYFEMNTTELTNLPSPNGEKLSISSGPSCINYLAGVVEQVINNNDYDNLKSNPFQRNSVTTESFVPKGIIYDNFVPLKNFNTSISSHETIDHEETTSRSLHEQILLGYQEDEKHREYLFNQIFHKKKITKRSRKPIVIKKRSTSNEINEFWNVHKELFSNWIVYVNRYGESKLVMIEGYDDFTDYDFFTDHEIQDMKNDPLYSKYVPKVIYRQMAKKINDFSPSNDISYEDKVNGLINRLKNFDKRKQVLEIKEGSNAERFEGKENTESKIKEGSNVEWCEGKENIESNLCQALHVETLHNEQEMIDNEEPIEINLEDEISVDDFLDKNLCEPKIEENNCIYNYVFGDSNEILPEEDFKTSEIQNTNTSVNNHDEYEDFYYGLKNSGENPTICSNVKDFILSIQDRLLHSKSDIIIQINNQNYTLIKNEIFDPDNFDPNLRLAIYDVLTKEISVIEDDLSSNEVLQIYQNQVAETNRIKKCLIVSDTQIILESYTNEKPFTLEDVENEEVVNTEQNDFENDLSNLNMESFYDLYSNNVNENDTTNKIEIKSSSEDDYDSDELVIDESGNLEEENLSTFQLIENCENFKDFDINISNQLVPANLNEKLGIQGIFNDFNINVSKRLALVSVCNRLLKAKWVQDFITCNSKFLNFSSLLYLDFKHFILPPNCIDLAMIPSNNLLRPDTFLNQPKMLKQNNLELHINMIGHGGGFQFHEYKCQGLRDLNPDKSDTSIALIDNKTESYAIEDLNELKQINTKTLMGEQSQAIISSRDSNQISDLTTYFVSNNSVVVNLPYQLSSEAKIEEQSQSIKSNPITDMKISFNSNSRMIDNSSYQFSIATNAGEHYKVIKSSFTDSNKKSNLETSFDTINRVKDNLPYLLLSETQTGEKFEVIKSTDSNQFSNEIRSFNGNKSAIDNLPYQLSIETTTKKQVTKHSFMDSAQILDVITSFNANNCVTVNFRYQSSTATEEQSAVIKSSSIVCNQISNVKTSFNQFLAETQIKEQFKAIKSSSKNSAQISNMKTSFNFNNHATTNLPYPSATEMQIREQSVVMKSMPMNSNHISNVKTYFNSNNCGIDNLLYQTSSKRSSGVITENPTSEKSNCLINKIEETHHSKVIKTRDFTEMFQSLNAKISLIPIDNLPATCETKNLTSNVKSDNIIRIERENEIRIISPAHRTEITYNFMKERVELIEIGSPSIKKRPSELDKLLNHTSDNEESIPIESSNRLVINEIVTSPSNIRITRNRLHNLEPKRNILKRKSASIFDEKSKQNILERKSDSFTTVSEDATRKRLETPRKRKSDSFPTICYNTRRRLELSHNILKTKSDFKITDVILESPVCDDNNINRLGTPKSNKFNRKSGSISAVSYNTRNRLEPKTNILKRKSDNFPIVNDNKRKFNENNTFSEFSDDVQIKKEKRKFIYPTIDTLLPIKRQKKFKYTNQVSTSTISIEKSRRSLVFKSYKNSNQNQDSDIQNFWFDKKKPIHRDQIHSLQNNIEHSQNKHSNLETIQKCTIKKYNRSIDNIKNSGNMATNVNSITNNVNRYYLRSLKNLENPNENLNNNVISSSNSITNQVMSRASNSTKNMAYQRRLSSRLELRKTESFDDTKSKQLKDLMNFLTIPQVDQFTKNHEYNIYIAQIHSHDQDIPELKVKPCNEPKYEYIDANVKLDESDYGISDTSSDEDFIYSADLTLTNYLKYYKMQSFCQSNKRPPTDEELIKKYKLMKGGQKAGENKQEKLDSDSRISSHNRYTRLNDRVLRKRCKHDSKEMRAHVMKPLNQMSYDEINSLREVDLISFLTFRDYIKSKQEIPVENTKKQYDLKIELRPILDNENIKRINSTNWKSDEDLHWLMKNVNCTSKNNSKINLRKHKLHLVKDHITKNSKAIKFRNIDVKQDFDTPSTSGGDFTTQRKTKFYDSDSDSSVDENYIRVLNKQVKSKRVQSNKSNDLCINELTMCMQNLDCSESNKKTEKFIRFNKFMNEAFTRKLLNLEPITEEYESQIALNVYNEIVQRMSEICFHNHSNKLLYNNPDRDFIGFPSIQTIDNKLLKQHESFEDTQLHLYMSMTSENDYTFLKYQNYCENPKKFKIKSYLRKFSRNDLTLFANNKHKKKIENFIREMQEANNFDTPVTENSREKDLLLIARTPEGEFIGIKYDTDRPETFENEMARLRWTDGSIRNILKFKSQIEHGEISLNQSANIVTNPQLTIEERILAIEKCVVRRKQERLHWLQLESKLVEYDSEIKSYLGLERADTEKALHCLEEILALPIEQLMLTKHPHVVDMVRRLRRYIGNVKAWDLSDEQTIEFSRGAERIRQKADEVYQKFKTLYETEHDKSFSDIYNNHVKEFNMKTKNMKEAQRFAVCAKPGTRQFEMDQMDDQLEIEAIKLKNELENKKLPRNEIQNATERGAAATSAI